MSYYRRYFDKEKFPSREPSSFDLTSPSLIIKREINETKVRFNYFERVEF